MRKLILEKIVETECSNCANLWIQFTGQRQSFLWLSKKKISQLSISDVTGIPLGQENLVKWECIFQSGKSKGILNRPEKVRENHSKYWKSQGISDKCYLLFLVIFKWTVYYLLDLINFSVQQTLKIYFKKWKKLLNKSRKKSVRKSGTKKGSVIIL